MGRWGGSQMTEKVILLSLHLPIPLSPHPLSMPNAPCPMPHAQCPMPHASLQKKCAKLELGRATIGSSQDFLEDIPIAGSGSIAHFFY
ncbi:MAG: hypothetical protein RMY29_007345 [Nostoc sp. CreGUA01]|nr:hypothetical protein [Nostoc sp. CreGUA01]